MKKTHLDWLWANNACRGSLIWVQEYNIHSLEEAWASCERGDWLLWLAQKLGVDNQKLALCGALCAHTVVQYMEDERSREAVRTAFLWGRGKATDEEVDAARHGASLAFCDSEGAVETWATRTALSVIEIADDGNKKYRTNTATIAAAAASWLVEDIGGNVAENQLRTASIARKILTNDVMNALKTI